MEGTEVGQGVDVRGELVRQRLTVLEDLVGVVDRQLTPLGSVVDRQSTAMWTDIPTCSGFAAEYAGRLAALQQGLVGLRSQLTGLQEALAASARSLGRVDQDIQDRLTALAARLADVPVLPHASTPTSAPGAPPSAPPAGEGTW